MSEPKYAFAIAVVVLGDPAPWRRLMWLAGEANVPVRVFQERPKRMPVLQTPAWWAGLRTCLVIAADAIRRPDFRHTAGRR